MPFEVRNPYLADETRTKTIPKIIEEFIEENWDETRTGVAVTAIKFGMGGERILNSGMDFTLKVYQIFENVRPLTHNGSRSEYLETLVVDLYILNNELDGVADPRAVRIQKWMEDLFLIHQGNMTKGIHEVRLRGGRILTDDPFSTNLTRLKLTIDITYILDIVKT